MTTGILVDNKKSASAFSISLEHYVFTNQTVGLNKRMFRYHHKSKLYY